MQGTELLTEAKKLNEKRRYSRPEMRSQKVLEKAALACSGVFDNYLYNMKTSYYSCGFNDS